MEQKTKWLESVCEVCGDKFRYQALLRKVRCGGLAVMPRRLCDACRETSLLESKKKSKRLKHQVKDEGEAKLSGRPSANGNVTGVIRATHAEIARALRISKSKVEQMEREVLLKIRNHPELKKLWVNFKEEGMPLPEHLAGTDQGLLLLEYQMQVADWWAVHDKIVEESRDRHQDCSTELHECLSEIERFQKQIASALTEVLAWTKPAEELALP